MKGVARSIFKLLIFLLLVAGISWLVQKGFSSDSVSKFDQVATQLSIPSDNMVCFLGSSRTQAAINPLATGQSDSDFKILNLGMRSCTSLPNSILASHLLDEMKPDVIIMEFTPMESSIPSETHQFMDALQINWANSVWNQMSSYSVRERANTLMDLVNSRVFEALSLKNSLKAALGISADTSRPVIGFTPSGKRLTNMPAHFLDATNLDTKVSEYTASQHLQSLMELAERAERNGVTLRYVLPTTFERASEKELALDLFSQLPNRVRFDYDDEFLSSINDHSLFRDGNHLNSNGAQIYTKWMIVQIDQLQPE